MKGQRAYCSQEHPISDADADQWCEMYHRPALPRERRDLILDALNAYKGGNIWQDVIHLLIDFDEEATDGQDPSYSSDVVVATDGTEYHYLAREGRWMTR